MKSKLIFMNKPLFVFIAISYLIVSCGTSKKTTSNDLATANVILVDQDLEEQLVYNIVKAVFENIDKLRASHPSMKEFSLDMATIGSLVPFHPGAVKYYKEQGVWTAELEAKQQERLKALGVTK